MEPLIKKVREYIIQNKLLDGTQRVVVGLSGGPDSVFLLHSLMLLKEEFKLQIYILHINHQLRGEESERDEKFCIELAQRWGLPIRVFRIKVEPYAKARKIGTEEASRNLRYCIYRLEAKRLGAKVALGHTADDRVETFLFHLIRGTGVSGLRSIPHSRDFIVRPLLRIFRREIWDYLKKHKIDFVRDSSNLSLFYTRNQIRRTLIPNLEQFNPHIREHIYHLTEIFEGIEEIVEKEIDKLWAEKCLLENPKIIVLKGDINKLSYLLFGGLVRRVIISFGFPEKGFNFGLVSRLKGATKGIYKVANHKDKKILAEKQKDIWLFFSHTFSPIPYEMELSTDSLELPDKLGHIEVKICQIPLEELKHSDETIGYIRGNKDKLKIRFPREGDRFIPFGASGGEIKLFRAMLEKGVPKLLRHYIPLVLVDNTIAWAGGLGISQLFRVNNSNEKIIKIRWTGDIAEFMRRKELWRK